MKRLKPIILRKSKPTKKELKIVKRNPIYFVLDRIIDTYNIGSLFRLADAVAVKKMFLCGEMEYPPSSRIHKAAVGTENWVPWEKRETTIEAVLELKKKGVQIVSVEQHKNSTDYQKLTEKLLKFPVAIVCGSETDGISEKVLDLSDLIVELPMYGINHSFNVWGSTAVVTYKVLEFLK